MPDSPLDLWSSSADAWIKHVGAGDKSREDILDVAMLAELGSVAGHKILDVGCGEGRFCRMLRARGANTVGLDPVSKLLHQAVTSEEGHYLCGSGEALPFASGTFDSVIFYLVLLDIPDFQKALREAYRVLRPGGNVLMTDISSLISASPDWSWDENESAFQMSVKNYFEERPEIVEWANIRVINYHRPQSQIFNAFVDAGFRLKRLVEPRPWDPGNNSRSAQISRVAPFFYITHWTAE